MSLFFCENVTRCYEGVPVVKDISLRLEEGEIVGLLGASGLGKTTLMGVLAGVDQPDSGRVVLEGEDVTGVPGKVGYMLQKDLLLPFKTALDNVALPLLIKGVPKAEARKRAKEQLALFGLAGSEGKYPHQLSGGMRQRAALARTHFLGADVILLDEPFSALDAMTKSEMHRWFLGVAEQMNLSAVFITHDVDEAITLSNRVYIMTGVPGGLSAEYSIPGPKGEDFNLTPEFLTVKRELLAAMA